MMNIITKILATIIVIALALFIAYFAIDAVVNAIMNSGTIAQVMSPDFDLERVMVEASK